MQNKKGKLLPDNPYNWNENSIVGILERMDYCGHTVNFKSYSKSQQIEKADSHHKRTSRRFSAIPMKQSLRKPSLNGVQELRANKTRPTKAERQGLFLRLSLLCRFGSKLHFATCKSF